MKADAGQCLFPMSPFIEQMLRASEVLRRLDAHCDRVILAAIDDAIEEKG